MIKLGYKVVAVVSNLTPVSRMFSICAGSLSHPTMLSIHADYRSMVEYKLYQWSFPIGFNGPLAVFEDLELAQAFSDSHDNYVETKIYRCEFDEVPLEFGVWYEHYLNNDRAGDIFYDRNIRFPLGARLARGVRLLHPV